MLKQQSRQRMPTASGFAFVPNRPFSWTVFVGLSDQPVNDMRLAFTCVPTFRSKRDAASLTRAA